METEFNKGDTVQLKSGGPIMTVTQTGETTLHGFQVWTVWFEKVKKFEGTFPPEALTKVDAPRGRAVFSSGR